MKACDPEQVSSTGKHGLVKRDGVKHKVSTGIRGKGGIASGGCEGHVKPN